jgi:adenylate kinase
MQIQTFVFFGQVGSGKGTQVKLLTGFLKSKDDKDFVYIGTGDIFRKIIESSDNSFDAQNVKEMLNAGQLIPDEMTNQLVASALETLSPDQHAIFDGYPRTVAQAEFFEERMEFYKREDIKIIYIELSEEEAMKRNLLRGRHDDTREGLAKRFNEYKNKVLPAMNYFEEKENYTIFTINGEQTIENVHKDIVEALGRSDSMRF